MNYSFRVGLLAMPLFNPDIWAPPKPGRGRGRLEAEERRGVFRSAGREVVTITFDDDAADALADILELDSDGLALDLERYTHVGYRPKARGLGGGRLGDAGEVLAFLAHRLASTEELHARLVRVVECRDLDATQCAPMPDFLVAGGRVLEIKTRELLDFHDITSVGTSDRFAGCGSLAEVRREGLVQLGFDDGVSFNRQTHKLRTQPGALVPFPALAGVLNVVLIRDHRVLSLRSKPELRVTYTDCRRASHDCWACCEEPTSQPLDALLVEMHNAPDALALAEFPEHEDWLRKYGCWSRALWARSATATAATISPLLASVAHWASTLGAERESWITTLWARYTTTAASERGVVVDLGDRKDDEEHVLGREPVPVPAELDDLPEIIAGLLSGDGDEGDGRWQVSGRGLAYVVMTARDSVRVRGLGEGWADGDAHQSDVVTTINNLLSALFGSGPEQADGARVAVRPVGVGVGNEHSVIAWRPARAHEGGWNRGLLSSADRPWITWLRMGDPRASLFAFRDGRVEFTIRRGPG